MLNLNAPRPMMRGGVIPLGASKGFDRHRGSTVLLEMSPFENWLTADVKNWTEATIDELCRDWLMQEMRASPNDKKKNKAAWFAQARTKYRLSQRQFERAWAYAVDETQSSWGRPGAPNKSSR